MLHRPMIAALLVPMCVAVSPAAGQGMAAPFDGHYTVTSLGAVADLPADYGGLVFKQDDPDTLLIAGYAGTADGAIFAVPVVRDAARHVVGFAGPAVHQFDATGLADGGIIGSLSYAGSALTYFSAPDNSFGQIPGAEVSINLDDQVVGHMLRSADDVIWEDRFKILTRDPGQWWRAQFFVDQAANIFPWADVLVGPIDGGPGAFVYVAGANPLFNGQDTVLIAKWGAGRVDGHVVDAGGDPIDASGFPFVLDIPGADGITIDSATDDVLISSSTTNTLFVVRGFDPCPADADGDGTVDVDDLNAVILDWGTDGSAHGGDVTGALPSSPPDGVVNVNDLNAVIVGWGACP